MPCSTAIFYRIWQKIAYCQNPSWECHQLNTHSSRRRHRSALTFHAGSTAPQNCYIYTIHQFNTRTNPVIFYFKDKASRKVAVRNELDSGECGGGGGWVGEWWWWWWLVGGWVVVMVVGGWVGGGGGGGGWVGGWWWLVGGWVGGGWWWLVGGWVGLGVGGWGHTSHDRRFLDSISHKRLTFSS